MRAPRAAAARLPVAPANAPKVASALSSNANARIPFDSVKIAINTSAAEPAAHANSCAAACTPSKCVGGRVNKPYGGCSESAGSASNAATINTAAMTSEATYITTARAMRDAASATLNVSLRAKAAAAAAVSVATEISRRLARAGKAAEFGRAILFVHTLI